MARQAKLGWSGALLLALLYPASAQGQVAGRDSLTARGPRHAITIAMGMLPRMSVSSAGAESNGVLGGISYTFWPATAWGLEVAAAAHSTEAHAWETHAVTSLLFGINWYPPLAPAPLLRPYVGVAAGSYTLSQTHVAEASTQGVGGVRLGGGVDAFPARWFRLGVRAAYHLTPEFDQPVDGLRSASGPELTLQLGVAFGHR